MGIQSKKPLKKFVAHKRSFPKSLASALFSATQQRVLGLLFGQPHRSFFATELIALAGIGSGSVQRQLTRLVESGLINITHRGNQKHYQANPTSPLYAELHNIMVKTVSLAEPLRLALAPFAVSIQAAFVFGSVAKKSDHAKSDIDVMILSKANTKLAYPDMFAALQKAEEILARPINPTLYTLKDWQSKRKQGNAFVTKVGAQPKLFLIGTETDLE